MKVIISDASRRMVYHRSGCIYASRITSAHQMTLNIRDAAAYGYHECTCCGGLKGAVRVNRSSLNKAGKDIAFEYLYDERSDTLYIRTETGFWKIFHRQGRGFLLYHCSKYDKTRKFEDLMHDEYHRQTDVRADESLLKLVHYIEEHDRAKRTIIKDYKKLPQRTKKESSVAWVGNSTPLITNNNCAIPAYLIEQYICLPLNTNRVFLAGGS